MRSMRNGRTCGSGNGGERTRGAALLLALVVLVVLGTVTTLAVERCRMLSHSDGIEHAQLQALWAAEGGVAHARHALAENPEHTGTTLRLGSCTVTTVIARAPVAAPAAESVLAPVPAPAPDSAPESASEPDPRPEPGSGSASRPDAESKPAAGASGAPQRWRVQVQARGPLDASCHIEVTLRQASGLPIVENWREG